MAVTLDKVKVGDAVPALKHTFSLEEMRLFSAWHKMDKYGHHSENQHTSEEVAKKLGRPAPVVQGLQVAFVAEEMLADYFGQQWYTTGKLSVRWIGMLLRGDTLTTKGRILDVKPEAGGTRVEVEVWGENQRGAQVMVGTGSARLA
ncbi:MAG: MaoC family dehydratase [Chloroflexi bacterium]|nr:MaoC family dehydratase [Chloroflexota bacterium]